MIIKLSMKMDVEDKYVDNVKELERHADFLLDLDFVAGDKVGL